MNSVFVDFQTRSKEVEGYFRFVIQLANAEISLRTTKDNEIAFSTHEHEELLKTFKATCYLMLYNLVESTMRNAIEAIFVELKLGGISFDDCRAELRQEILKNFKKRDMDKLLPKLLSLARDVIHETFERKENFAGNLDARIIRRTATRFGFKEPTGRDFSMLQTVKDLRNDLAHGVKSFAEVGRNASPSDLEEARSQTVEILSQTLQNIKSYLQNQHYLESTNKPAANNIS
ncbi:MAG: hypothetical protein JWQ71_2895 [Pedosphaera sp.]|nr:hypothetical protein [Pedosphaera sp.]